VSFFNCESPTDCSGYDKNKSEYADKDDPFFHGNTFLFLMVDKRNDLLIFLLYEKKLNIFV
jgi:hypothetical protein